MISYKFTTTILIALFASVQSSDTLGAPEKDNKTTPDIGDRLGLGILNDPYNFKDYYGNITDVINKTETGFWFMQVHWAITGWERGFYGDDKIEISSRCFGDHALQNVNQYVYTITMNPFSSIFESAFPIIYMTYMLGYMVFSECGFDHLLNDYATYCWYKGCWPKQFLYKMLDNFLYILRAINDAAIVWKEGLDEFSENPDRTHVDEERDWAKLSAQTAQTLGAIAQDVTGFEPITEPDYHTL